MGIPDKGASNFADRLGPDRRERRRCDLLRSSPNFSLGAKWQRAKHRKAAARALGVFHADVVGVHFTLLNIEAWRQSFIAHGGMNARDEIGGNRKALGPLRKGFDERLYELRREDRIDRVTRAPQNAHAIGKPMSQREKRGFKFARFVGWDAAESSIGTWEQDATTSVFKGSEFRLNWLGPALFAESCTVGVAQGDTMRTCSCRSGPPAPRSSRFEFAPPVIAFGVAQLATSDSVLRLLSVFPASL